MVSPINHLFNAIGNAVMRFFDGASPWPGLVAFSFVITLFALAVFRFLSNQRALAAARNRAFARILEFRLYSHEPRAAFGVFARVLGATLGYLKHYALPIAILLPPVLLLLAQMSLWFEHRPLRPGETALLTVTLRPGLPLDEVSAVPPDGVSLDTDALRIAGERQIVWRLRADAAAGGAIDVRTPGGEVAKTLIVSPQPARVSTLRTAGGAWARLAHPAEPAIERDAGIESISIAYPRREICVGNRPVSWVLACFMLTIIIGLALKPLFGVEL